MPITSPATNHPVQDLNRGEPILIEVRKDTESDGNLQTTVEQALGHGIYPTTTPRFGTFTEFVYNDRNTKESRIRTTYVDTNDLFSPVDRAIAAERGGKGLKTTTTLVDATGGTPAPTANGLLVVSAEVRDLKDRAHALRIDTTVDEWVELQTEINEDPRAGGNRTILSRQVVAHGTSLPTDSTKIEASLEELDEGKALKTVLSAPDGFGTLNTKNKIDGSAFGTESTRAETQVDTGTALPTGSYLTAELYQQDLGNGKSRLVHTTVPSWTTFVDEDEEKETGEEILVTRQIVDRAALPTMTKGEARSWKTLKNIDDFKALYTDRVIDADILTTTYTEYHQVRYYFPAYYDPDDPFFVIEAGEKSVIASNKSSDHEFFLPCRFEITYHSSVPSINEVFQFKPIDIDMVAPDFRLNNRNVLIDAGTLQYRQWYTLGGGISYVDVTYSIPASSPTATEYLAQMGTEKLIGDDISRWKFNLWKRTKIYMTLPDISLDLSGYLIY